MRFKYTLAILFIIFISACKKETVNAPYPYNEITAFAVAQSGGDSLQAAINNGKIILYWPSSEELPDSITPVISISENATIKPASGQRIALRDSVTYTVTSQSGSTVTYTLHLNINQAEILMSDKDDVRTSFGSTFGVPGLYNVIADTTKTSIYLISKAGASIRLEINKLGYEGSYATSLQAVVPEEGIDTGWYKVTINSGVRTITSSRYFVYVAPGTPVLILTDPFTLKRGDTHVLPGKFLHDLGFVRARNDDDDEDYHLEIVSVASTGVTVRVPDDYPVGTYSKIQISYQNADGSLGFTDIRQQMTITE